MHRIESGCLGVKLRTCAEGGGGDGTNILKMDSGGRRVKVVEQVHSCMPLRCTAWTML